MLEHIFSFHLLFVVKLKVVVVVVGDESRHDGVSIVVLMSSIQVQFLSMSFDF